MSCVMSEHLWFLRLQSAGMIMEGFGMVTELESAVVIPSSLVTGII